MILHENDDIKAISDAFFDPFEYLSLLIKNNHFDDKFKALIKRFFIK